MTTITTTRTTSVLMPVYCRSCRAHLGYRYGSRKHGLFCTDPICPAVPPTRENADEERNGILLALAQTREFTRGQLATMLGVSRQRVTQLIIEARDGSVRESPHLVSLPRARLPSGD